MCIHVYYSISQRQATNFLWFMACISALKNNLLREKCLEAESARNLLQSKANFILKVQHCLWLTQHSCSTDQVLSCILTKSRSASAESSSTFTKNAKMRHELFDLIADVFRFVLECVIKLSVSPLNLRCQCFVSVEICHYDFSDMLSVVVSEVLQQSLNLLSFFFAISKTYTHSPAN